MEDKPIPRWRRPVFLIAAALVLLLILGGAGGGIYLSQRPPAQPIQFPHSLHVGLGASCQYCHPGVRWGPSAGLPSNEKCWGCHQQIAKTTPELDKLAGYVERGESIPWVPVAIMPDFVQFTHQPHLGAGLECQTCHGNVAEMTTARPQAGMDMGWCLSCHRKMRPDNAVKLTDCGTCHY